MKIDFVLRAVDVEVVVLMTVWSLYKWVFRVGGFVGTTLMLVGGWWIKNWKENVRCRFISMLLSLAVMHLFQQTCGLLFTHEMNDGVFSTYGDSVFFRS